MLKPGRMEKIVRSMSSILSCPLTIKVLQHTLLLSWLTMYAVSLVSDTRQLYTVNFAGSASSASLSWRLPAPPALHQPLLDHALLVKDG